MCKIGHLGLNLNHRDERFPYPLRQVETRHVWPKSIQFIVMCRHETRKTWEIFVEHDEIKQRTRGLSHHTGQFLSFPQPWVISVMKNSRGWLPITFSRLSKHILLMETGRRISTPGFGFLYLLVWPKSRLTTKFFRPLCQTPLKALKVLA